MSAWFGFCVQRAFILRYVAKPISKNLDLLYYIRWKASRIHPVRNIRERYIKDRIYDTLSNILNYSWKIILAEKYTCSPKNLKLHLMFKGTCCHWLIILFPPEMYLCWYCVTHHLMIDIDIIWPKYS